MTGVTVSMRSWNSGLAKSLYAGPNPTSMTIAMLPPSGRSRRYIRCESLASVPQCTPELISVPTTVITTG